MDDRDRHYFNDEGDCIACSEFRIRFRNTCINWCASPLTGGSEVSFRKSTVMLLLRSEYACRCKVRCTSSPKSIGLLPGAGGREKYIRF